MTAAAVLAAARQDGLSVRLDRGALKVEGATEALARWVPELRAVKPDLLRMLSEGDPGPFPSLAVLRDAAGEDWPDIADNPAALAALAVLLRTQAQRDRGEQPTTYTQAALCLTCGPVWLWEGAPARLIACPWCLCQWGTSRPPRPPVRCSECVHFERSETTPAAGLGLCRIANAKNKRTEGHWPEADHACGAWRPLEPQTARPE